MTTDTQDARLSTEQNARAAALETARRALAATGIAASSRGDAAELLTVASWVVQGDETTGVFDFAEAPVLDTPVGAPVDLTGITDPDVWARAFLGRFGINAHTSETLGMDPTLQLTVMTSWFRRAIETGRDDD